MHRLIVLIHKLLAGTRLLQPKTFFKPSKSIFNNRTKALSKHGQKYAYSLACSTDEMIKALTDGIKNLRLKEVSLGYDKIWNIGK